MSYAVALENQVVYDCGDVQETDVTNYEIIWPRFPVGSQGAITVNQARPVSILGIHSWIKNSGRISQKEESESDARRKTEQQREVHISRAAIVQGIPRRFVSYRASGAMD